MSAQNWIIDKDHSNIVFKAKHLMITTVTGSFREYNAEVEMEGEDWSTLQVKFSAETASVDTGNEQRDGHLRSDDFFNSESYPELAFESTGATVKGDELTLSGTMTIRGVSKPIRLDAEIGGIARDPWGNTKAGLSFKGRLNRKDFDLKFHVVNEVGDLLVSDDIRLEGEVQLLRVVEAEA